MPGNVDMTSQPCTLQGQILLSALTAFKDMYLTMKIINRKVFNFCIFFSVLWLEMDTSAFFIITLDSVLCTFTL